MKTDPEIEAIEFDLVLEAIHARYGYDLRGYSRASLQRRLQAALSKSGLAHLGEFQHRLLRDAGFFASVLDQLTVQVSEMFRDPSFYLTFRRDVTPVLRTYPELKVWHAGCATGEEIYATAILLLEEGLYDRTQIYATDVSASALERAREGLFSEAQAAEFADNYRAAGGQRQFSDYYSEAYGRIAMREELRRHVVFFQHNLVSDYALGEMHVVFCRNVLIYFDSELRERVLEMLVHGLRRGGFLCLGASESAPEGGRKLGLRFFSAEQRIYQKDGSA